jgi:ribonuclease HI
MDEFGEEIHRLFAIEKQWGRTRIPRDQLIVYNTDKHISQLQRMKLDGSIERDAFTMVIHIDGACRDNGYPSATAAYGLYFGPGSKFNASGLLDPDIAQTSTRAEIEALSQALKVIQDICKDDFKLTRITIATDSSYLVSVFTEWIEDWIEQDGKKSNRKPVKYFKELTRIHQLLDNMEYGDDGGIECEFWDILREQNRDSDALARSALSGSS